MPLHNKVLVVDDDASMRELLRGLLAEAGYQVVEAENGREAVALALSELPALILLDIHMPVMDGLEACKAIKADNVLRCIPVIMLTADGSVREVEQAMSLGAETYLTKPAPPAQILQLVRSVLK
jgi:CheY-like chemotaxis protein